MMATMVTILILCLIMIVVSVILLVKSWFTMKNDEKKASKMSNWGISLLIIAVVVEVLVISCENGAMEPSGWDELSYSEKERLNEQFNGVDYDDIMDEYKEKYFE